MITETIIAKHPILHKEAINAYGAVVSRLLYDFNDKKINGSIELHINNGILIKIKKIIVENV